MPAAHPSRMFSAARTVVAFGLAFQVAGLGKLLVVARYFGAGPALDAYYLGLVIPTFLAGLAAALLQIGFVPAYMEAKARNDSQASERIMNDSLMYTVILLGAIAAIVYVAERPVMGLLWPDLNPTTHAFLWMSFGLLIWSTPITGFIDGVVLLLNAEGRFTAAAAAPIANVIVSTALLILSPEKNLSVLIWSLFSGLAAQVAILVVALGRGGIRFAPRISYHPARIRSLVAIGLPVLLASILANSIPAFLQVMAARNGPGAVSAFGYASRLQRSLMQAIVMSVSLILLPHFARLLAERKQQELRDNLNRVFAATTVFYFAALAFVGTGGQTALDLLLQRGRFTSADGMLVWEVWLALTTGLLGATWGIFLARLFQAERRPWVIAKLAVVSVVANATLSLLFIGRFGLMGIALANSVAYTVVMTLFHVMASRTVGRIVDRTTLAFVVVALAANVVAGFAAMLWQKALAQQSDILIVVGQMAIILGCNLLVVRRRPLCLSPRAVLRF